MAEPRSAAQEAGDPSTSPERLLELTEKHPQLQKLIVLNPSCPEVARQWILATNPWAKQAYEASLEDGPTDGAAPQEEVPTEASVWGDLGTGASEDPEPPAAPAAPAAAASPPAPDETPTPSVRIAQNAPVVPLGPVPTGAAPASSPAAQPSPAPAPSASASPAQASPAPASSPAAPASAPTAAPAVAAAQAPWTYDAPPAPGAYEGAPQPAYGASAAFTAGAPPEEADAEEEGGSGTRRRAWYACGGCLLLALILVVVMALVGRAWLSGGEDEEYQRDSSTTAAEQSPTEEPSEEPTEEPDPVSPAPAGAHEMTELRSPTGNISCMLEEDSVACSVVERDFGETGLEDCDNGPFSIQVAEGEAERACGTSFLSEAGTALEYDESATHGNMACTSRFDGMTCWNTLTGKGFMVNRVTYETF